MLALVKPPGDHARLARAFEIPPTRYRFAAVVTGGAAFVGLFAPGALLLAGGLVAGFGGLAAGDRRRVRAGLRELEAWGFPIEGYRAWLLADEPTFDVELAREVDTEILATSARAIDESVKVSRSGERAFRVVTRRVALPSHKKDGPALLVGDRQLLFQLHARLLAPLHADVGITRMRMGERATLPAVAASLPAPATQPADGGMGAFREQALVAPPALQALVDDGGDRELPREAQSLADQRERIIYATGGQRYGAGTVIAIAFGGMTMAGGFGEPIGFAIGAAGGFVGGIATAINGNRRNAKRAQNATAGQGFPIEDYELWLLSGRPLLDIELARAIDPTWLVARLAQLPRAYSVSTKSEVPWVEEVKWLDDRTVRIETRPALVEPPGRIEPFYGGSHQMFGTFLQQVLGPLHYHAGIARVRMGGYLTRRV